MNLPTTASDFVRTLHPNAPSDHVLHILRLDPSGHAESSSVSIAELITLDGEIAAKHDHWNQFISVGLWPPGSTQRSVRSIACVDAFFLDIDLAGDAKPQRPTTSEQAMAFLVNEAPFKPTLITQSGRGLHAFYCLAEPIRLFTQEDRHLAKTITRQFETQMHLFAASRHGWKFDTVADLARVHRVPFSKNLKPDAGGECLPIWAGANRFEISQLKVSGDAPAPSGKSRAMPSSSQAAIDIMRTAEIRWAANKKDGGGTNAAAMFEGCRFLPHALQNAPTLDEPLWHAVINLVSKCEDGTRLAHAFSENNPHYDPAETNKKAARAIESPPLGCDHIGSTLGFGGCEGCPFVGRIKSPIELASRSSNLVQLMQYYAYVASTGAFIDLRDLDGDPLSPDKFKRFHAGSALGGNADDLFLKDNLSTKVLRRDWRPDVQQRIFEQGSNRILNTYTAPAHSAPPANASRFLEHLEYLIAEPDECDVVKDYLAHLVQHPHRKITYGISLVSPQGSGKTYIHEVMSRVLGGENVRVVNGRSLDDKFRHHMAGRVLLVMEEVSMADRSQTYEGLKALISNETDEFEAKYLPMETMKTPRGVMIFTNHAHALFLAQDDRRFFVSRCSGPHPDGPNYYKPLFDELDSPEFIAGVWTALKSRDISAFNPHRPPFITAAKSEMIENSRPEIDILLEELLGGSAAPFDRDLMIYDEIRHAVRASRPDASLTDKQIKRALSGRGIVLDPQARQCPVGGRRVKLYMRNPAQFAALSAAELGRKYAGGFRRVGDVTFESVITMAANN